MSSLPIPNFLLKNSSIVVPSGSSIGGFFDERLAVLSLGCPSTFYYAPSVQHFQAEQERSNHFFLQVLPRGQIFGPRGLGGHLPGPYDMVFCAHPIKQRLCRHICHHFAWRCSLHSRRCLLLQGSLPHVQSTEQGS